ncbi:hypothetical protein NBRC116583_36940 [Arenicella sp. 4NH20-0111]|uniref:hypothetical protein n=1 Tax=Arenicella sp. 4NH20-0111 TaxID=3127648 RepID=UPI0031091D44
MIISNPTYEPVSLSILTNNGPVGPSSIPGGAWQQVDMPAGTNTIQITMGQEFNDDLRANDCVTYTENGLLLSGPL